MISLPLAMKIYHRAREEIRTVVQEEIYLFVCCESNYHCILHECETF